MLWKRMIATVPAVVLALGGAQTAAAQAEIEALVFWDVLSTNKTARACRDLGYTLTEARSSEAEFIAFLNAQPWDFIGIELPWDLITQKETVAQLLENHVAAGGRLLVNFNNLDEWPRLQALMGLDDAVEMLVPEDVAQTDPLHASWPEPWFNTPLPAQFQVWTDSGDHLVPSSGAIVTGQFPDLSGAIVLANNRLTLVNGFNWDENRASFSFVRHQIQYIMACPADLDQSTGKRVLDIFDFLAFQDLFVRRDPLANMIFDPSFDIFDFLAFQDAFIKGCQ
jgi:hypothetical protein